MSTNYELLLDFYSNTDEFIAAVEYTSGRFGFRDNLVEKDFLCSMVLMYLYLLKIAFRGEVSRIDSSPYYRASKGNKRWDQDLLCKSIYQCTKKLHRTILTCRDYRKLILDKTINTKDTFWYMDPPYTMASEKGYYHHNFLPESHRDLLNSIKSIIGKFMISYDDSPLIREIYKDYEIHKLKNFDNEIIITNYKLNKQPGLFGEDYLL